MTTAIIIDIDNIGGLYDIQVLLKHINNNNNLSIYKYAVGNYVGDELNKFLISNGFDIELNSIKRKNRSDIKIMLYITRLLNDNNIKKIILFSSDQDFDLIIKEIFKANKIVEIYGYNKSTSDRIKNMGDIFVPIDKFIPTRKSKSVFSIVKNKTSLKKFSETIKKDKLISLSNQIFGNRREMLISVFKRELRSYDKKLIESYNYYEWRYFEKYITNKYPKDFNYKKGNNGLAVVLYKLK